MRYAQSTRKTKETEITIKIKIEGSGKATIKSEIGFLNHMLETCAKHGLFDLTADIKGDIHVDQHHVVEDTGIVLGDAFNRALGNKRGIQRAGFFIFPMDESLVMVALDISGRPYLKMDAKFRRKKVGDLETDLLEDFFRGFVNSLKTTLHIKVYYGRSDHHKIEGIFKAFSKALKQACTEEKRAGRTVPSTKGKL
jgi:imidazoleglycerol-phosphate dehydratase